LYPERLRAYHLSPDDMVAAVTSGNLVILSGNARIRDQTPMVPSKAMVVNPQELGSIPIKPGENLYLRDLALIADDADIATGYALVNGKRSLTGTRRTYQSGVAPPVKAKSCHRDPLGSHRWRYSPPGMQPAVVRAFAADRLPESSRCGCLEPGLDSRVADAFSVRGPTVRNAHGTVGTPGQ
jgi:hypothetical protein